MSDKTACPACGFPNDPSAETCENCGSSLATGAEPDKEISTPETSVKDAPLVSVAEPAQEPATESPADQEPATRQEEKRRPQPKSKPTQSGRNKKSQKSGGQKKQSSPAMRNEVSVRDGFLRIQVKMTPLFTVTVIAAAAIVAIILYLNDSDVPQQALPSQVAQQQETNTGPSLAQIQAAKQRANANPKDPAAVLAYSHVLHDAKMYDQAIPVYRRYLAMVPDDPDAQVDLGVCYYALGDFGSALTEMKAAVKAHPDHQLGNFNLGVVSLAAHDTTAAMDWLKKAVKINPDSQTGKNAATMIKRVSIAL